MACFKNKQVKKILDGLKTCKIIISNTEKNSRTKFELNWLEEDQINFVKSLTLRDFTKGPCDDYDFPTNPPLWFFKKTYSYKKNNRTECTSIVLYIKLSCSNNRIVVRSLHIDEKIVSK